MLLTLDLRVCSSHIPTSSDDDGQGQGGGKAATPALGGGQSHTGAKPYQLACKAGHQLTCHTSSGRGQSHTSSSSGPGQSHTGIWVVDRSSMLRVCEEGGSS